MNNQEERNQKYPISVQHGKPRLSKLKKGWIRVSIGDLFEEVNRPVEMDDNEFYDLVTVKRSRGGVVKREKLQGKNIAVKSQFYVREGDFLISKRQIVHGACGFVPKELDGAIVSNEYLVLHCKDIIIPSFLNYLKDTIYFQQVCFHSSIGVHVEKMLFRVSTWYQWKIDIPKLEEQEKIAIFLSAVDKKLTQLRRKKELLETYKRGLMQKLFSQQIRFKQDDGTAFTDWQEKKLGDICEIIGGGTPDTYQSEYWGGNIQWFTPTELKTKYISESSKTITNLGLNNSSAKLLPKGSLLFC